MELFADNYYELDSTKKEFQEIDPAIGILYAFAALILLSPTIHFWYLSWILPFAVLLNRISWIILSLTICLYFTAKSAAWYGALWAMPVWAQSLEWLLFFQLQQKG